MAVVTTLLAALVFAACSGGGDGSGGSGEGAAGGGPVTTIAGGEASTSVTPSPAATEAPRTAPTTVTPPPAPPGTVAAPATTVARVTPPVTGPARVTPAAGHPPEAACPAVPARVDPRTDRPTYRLALDLRPDERVVLGSQLVRFTPDRPTDRLVFRLWANAPRIADAGGKIEVGVDGGHQPDPTTLVVPRALRAGETTEVTLTWQLTLPDKGTNDRIVQSGSTVRLGSFIPVLAWHPGLGWATEAPTSGFAESSLSLPSDFDVTLVSPPGLDVLATGVSDRPGHWVASGVPDWAATVGDFTVVTGTAEGGGGPVAVTVGVDRRVGDAPGPYLDKVRAVIADFGERFGAYPWPSYSVSITPGLTGGIEYPMHVMQGAGSLGRTTSHEVAHQWFYGLVATNQGGTPWIDEGLASWAEARYEDSLQSMVTRQIPEAGRGMAGQPMTFWATRQPAYYRSVYVQTAQALAALGPPDLVDCALRQLVARQAYRVTSGAEVIAVLAGVFPDAPAVLARYGIRA